MIMPEIKNLKALYKEKKQEIKSRLKEFRDIGNSSKDKIFSELCFCICTPQSKARVCDKAISKLVKSKLLPNGSKSEISKILKNEGVRFHKNKARFIVLARDKFDETNLTDRIKESRDNKELREFIADNIKGLGLKESGHFLRNIGLGKNLAILDRHILKNLKNFNAIDEIPKTLTKKRYLEIESKMVKFSEKIEIPMDELDLLFWSRETGEVFK